MASTVGTIMSLLVFLTFLSLITNQYVPVWMKDAEASHMGETLNQFGSFKSSIDLQILAAQTAYDAKQRYVEVTSFSSVRLGVDGVPIFTTPTIGDLRADEKGSEWSVAFDYDIGGNMTTVPEADCACGGSVRLQVFNRYFLPQNLAFENGAIIRAQRDGQVVKGEPAFQVRHVPDTSVEVDFSLIELFVVGSGGVTGVGAEGLSATLKGVEIQTYQDIQTAITITATTRHGPAWYRFFNDTLSAAFPEISADYYESFPAESDLIADFGVGGIALQLTANNPIYLVQSVWNEADRNYAFTLQFKLDVPLDSINVLPVLAFRLLHAVVDVRVGSL